MLPRTHGGQKRHAVRFPACVTDSIVIPSRALEVRFLSAAPRVFSEQDGFFILKGLHFRELLSRRFFQLHIGLTPGVSRVQTVLF